MKIIAVIAFAAAALVLMTAMRDLAARTTQSAYANWCRNWSPWRSLGMTNVPSANWALRLPRPRRKADARSKHASIRHQVSVEGSW